MDSQSHVTGRKPNPFRRPLHSFSLRTLLLLSTVIGASLGWTIHKARQQGLAVAAFEELGCTVRYADDESLTLLERLRILLGDDHPRNVVELSCLGRPVADAELTHLRGLTQLKVLDLTATPVTDAGLMQLWRLTTLETLYLSHTQVTDAGLAHLGQLTALEALDLEFTQVTEKGLVHLQRLGQIQRLYLGGTRLADKGLENLRAFTRLSELGLDGTQVTDAGLVQLYGFSSLTRLHLKNTVVTVEGLEDLKKALPALNWVAVKMMRVPATIPYLHNAW